MLSTVRTEIKTWERTFKALNGRDPLIQDIKEQPAIADKYKLYKKLSKAAASQPLVSNHVLDPQPHDARPALLLSQPRTIEKTSFLSTFNPFSPQKSKGKQSDTRNKTSVSNPFATPTKTKALPLQNKEPSPDPVPLLQLSQTSTSNLKSSPFPSNQNNALSRARKRLRGEPVSPSPNKEKRRRVNTQVPRTLSTPPTTHNSGSEDEDVEAANSSFVDDSPVKAPRGGKPFKLLFEDAAAPLNPPTANHRKKIARSKTTPASVNLFGEGSKKAVTRSTTLDADMGWDLETSYAPSNNSFSTKDGEEPSRHVQPLTMSKSSRTGKAANTRVLKRSLSDAEMERVNTVAETTNPIPPLLPPSPPPTTSSYRPSMKHNIKGKGKASTGGRKRAKVADGNDDGYADTDDDGEDGEEYDLKKHVKLVDRTRSQGVTGDETRDLELDSILGMPRNHASPSPYASPETEDLNEKRRGTYEVDLPDSFLRVLALSPSESKAREIRQERVFRQLLYGQRASHYDPAKGGEIWDVGEELEGEAVTEEEDDWEGEPVPWEVGEL